MQHSNLIDNGGYAFHAETSSDSVTVINAANNWWGTSEASAIAEMIYDNADYPAYPIVAFAPFASGPIPIDDTSSTAVVEIEGVTLPNEIALAQNYPNPFNAGTLIEFELARSSQVELTVYDLLGREVRTLVSQPLPGGVHQVYFDGCDRRGRALASAVYFYRLRSANTTISRKMLLLK